MSQRNLFTSLRSPLSKKSDEHGVTDLLREVSQRDSSLTDKERNEVGEMVKRMEQHKAKPSPMTIMKEKLAEISLGSDISGSNHITKNLAIDDIDNDDSDGSSISTSGNGTTTKTNNAPNTPGSVKKLAKYFFQKMQYSSSPNPGHQKEQTASKVQENRGKDLFRSFSIKGIQNRLKTTTSVDQQEEEISFGTETDRRPEILKDFEQSSQSGRDMLRNLTKKIQSPLSLSSKKARTPETAPVESKKIRAIRQIQSPTIVDLPKKVGN